ncbi:MAG: CRISPR-associated endonuclease Cas1 [Ardenticatenaceae bacterium]|nr:CRISPR-associated endonuclease Cas1 [Anaerolineales bacterium]MCB9009412.1 CRISPR-associated endonuclease Cas1 [Ardenticatenaceae bacterium]
MPIIQHLIADEFGSHIGKYQGRLKVTKAKEVLAQAPLLHLETVTVASRGVSISADAIQACTERGIPVHFLSSRGNPYAGLYSAGLMGTVLTRRAQMAAYNDLRGVHLALGFAGGKIQNQATLLKYTAKYRKDKDPALYKELHWLAGETVDHMEEICTLDFMAPRENYYLDDIRSHLLSVEGRAAKKYWQGFKLLLPEALDWPGRQGRGARDPFNSALNYGYGILYGQVERAIILAGLDPYAGFIHVDRPGKPSLVLDLIEEFRAPVVDRTLLGLVNKGVAIEQDEQGRLVEKTRRFLAEKVLARLESQERYEKKRHPLRAIIQMQARRLASYVRGERDSYDPFLASW